MERTLFYGWFGHLYYSRMGSFLRHLTGENKKVNIDYG